MVVGVGWKGVVGGGGKGYGKRTRTKENEKRKKGKNRFFVFRLFSHLCLRLPALLVYALGAARDHELAAIVDFDDSVDDRDVCFFVREREFWKILG